MAQQTRENIKSNFQSGDIPTEGNYIDLIDSSVSIKDHNSGSIVISGSLEISGSQNVDLLIAKKLKVKGSDVTIENGHISMSGDLIATGSISASGTITANEAFLNNGGSVQFANGTVNEVRLRGANGGLAIMSGSNTGININPGDGHITASGGISASGDIISDKVFSNVISGKTDGTGIILGSASNIHVTASGDISASGTLIANEANITGNITSSGNISASGDNHTLGGFVNLKELRAIGDSDTKIALGDNTGRIDFTSDNSIQLRLDPNKVEFTNITEFLINAPITASGNISGSSITTASLARVESKDLILDDVKLTTSFTELNYLDGLTSNEANQIKNIGSKTISNTQWGYVGNMNQNVMTSSDVVFNKVSTPDLRLLSASAANAAVQIFQGGKVNVQPASNNFSIHLSMPSMVAGKKLFGPINGCLVSVTNGICDLSTTQIIITSNSTSHLFSVITHFSATEFVINVENPTEAPIPSIAPVTVFVTFIPTF